MMRDLGFMSYVNGVVELTIGKRAENDACSDFRSLPEVLAEADLEKSGLIEDASRSTNWRHGEVNWFWTQLNKKKGSFSSPSFKLS